MNLTLPVVTSAALLDSVNPCAVSVLLLTIGFLVSLNSSRKKILSVTGLYILGIFLIYIIIGLGILKTLTFFGVPHFMTRFGALILIIFGLLNLLESIIPDFPIKLGIPKFIKPQIARHMYQATSVSAFFMGILVGLFEFPCTGGPYLLILSLLHDKSTWISGFLYLIYYNLIFVSPLIAIIIITTNPRITSKLSLWRRNHAKKLSIITSTATIFLGFVIFLL
jgi:cytochrome c biogenesis protein CcdA